MAVYTQYKGKGEHSVHELERIIAEREEELHLIRSNQSKIVSHSEMDFILHALNITFIQTEKSLKGTHLGDIERKMMEETKAKAKELIEKFKN